MVKSKQASLVGVHVALRPASGLENNEREMVNQLPRDNLAQNRIWAINGGSVMERRTSSEAC